eukprot:s2393_g2.t2
MREWQTGGCAICAAHPELPLIAVGTGGDPGFLFFFEDSLRRKQRFEQRCDALAWHKKNPVLAVLSINAAMAKIQIFSATDGPLSQVWLAHFRLHVLGMHPATALCWARSHLVVAGQELCVWPCTVKDHFTAAAPSARHPMDELTGLELDPSERFLATVHHRTGLGKAFRRRAVTETLLGCCGEVLQGHCQAASWAPAARGPAILATLGLQRDITVWRESAFEEVPGFVAEARWSASDLQASAMVWVIGNDAEQLEARLLGMSALVETRSLRMRETGGANRPHKAELVVAGETTWCIELQSSPGGQGPLSSICRKLPELPGFDQSAGHGYGPSGGLFSVRKLGNASFNAWLCSPSGDLRRVCLDQNSTSVDAVAGSVVDMALHEYWGLLALLLRGGRTIVWVAEIPESRACFDSGRYRLPEGDILSDEALSTGDCPSFTSLVWIPGHRLPPRLLGFSRDRDSLLMATSLDISGTVQPWSEVLWKSDAHLPVRHVQQMQASKAGGVLSLLVQDDDVFFVLAHVEVSSSSSDAPILEPICRHRLWASCPQLGAFALELGSFAAMKEGDVSGQFAFWAPDSDQVVIRALQIEAIDPSTGAVRVGETLQAPLSSSQTLQGGVLRLQLCDEFLVALTTRAEILVWSLAGGDLGHVLLCHSHTLATHQLKREGPGAEDDTVPFRLWNRDGPVNKRPIPWSKLRQNCGHQRSLHPGGGLLLAAAASASDSIAPATALLRQRGNTGDIWHTVDLHPEALPLEQGSLLAVCIEGALLHAGFCLPWWRLHSLQQLKDACKLLRRALPTIPIPSSGFSETDRRPSRDESFSNFYTCARARSFMWAKVRMWLLLFLAVAVCSHSSHAGNAPEFVRKQAPRRGLVSVAVSPQGVLQLDDDSGAGRHSEDVVTDPTFAESAGKWKVHYDGWARNHKFEDVEIFCDGKFTLWNGHTTKLSTSEDDKKALCNRGAMKSKIQWVNKDWAGDNRKWECGWYDAKTDKIHVYHYVKGHRSTKDGHKAGDDFWGKIDRSKREAEVNCPTTAPPEGKSGTSARWTAGATALLAPRGIPPLVDLDFMEFHCADAVARCERVSGSAPASSSQMHAGADGLDGGSGATAASLFEDDFEARMAKLRSSWAEAEDDPSPCVPTQENGETTSAGWHVSEMELDELGRFLQTRALLCKMSSREAVFHLSVPGAVQQRNTANGFFTRAGELL